MIELFAVHWHIIPSGGYTPISDGVGAWFKSLIGPALALAIPFGAVMARVIRSAFVEEFDKDYVRTAEGLGLTTATIVARNVLRNAVTAPLTSFGVGVGVLFSGAVLIESLFQLPGLGSMLVDGIRTGDFGLVAAVGIFGGVAFVIVNAVVDVLCSVFNPRESTGSR
jgi:peptide/nickel transport system permease protein